MKGFSEVFMSLAISEAKKALDEDEVPVGCIIVKEGKVIGSGYNQVIKNNCVADHAEIVAIKNAGRVLKNFRLKDCDVYVTLEPCHMCAKALVDARVSNLYFGALEPKTGSVISIDNFLDTEHLNHNIDYAYGYMAKECSELLTSFFKSKRLK